MTVLFDKAEGDIKLYARGRAYHALGEWALAEADYLNAIAQYPEYALPYWGLGDVYFEQGDVTSALDNYMLYAQWVADPPMESVTDATVVARISDLQELMVDLHHVGIR